MTDPLWITENTTWTSSDGIRALAVRVEVLPGMSLTLEGSGNSSLVLALDDCGSLSKSKEQSERKKVKGRKCKEQSARNRVKGTE